MWQAAKISAVTTHTERRACEKRKGRRKQDKGQQNGLSALHRRLG
jgi:hypothetical protein